MKRLLRPGIDDRVDGALHRVGPLIRSFPKVDEAPPTTKLWRPRRFLFTPRLSFEGFKVKNFEGLDGYNYA
ncbi:MAG: hypothetical protein ACP5K1_02305 [Candidatus Bathyarchaeia archaeon]